MASEDSFPPAQRLPHHRAALSQTGSLRILENPLSPYQGWDSKWNLSFYSLHSCSLQKHLATLTAQDLTPLESSSSPLSNTLKWRRVFQPFISFYPRDCLVGTCSRSHTASQWQIQDLDLGLPRSKVFLKPISLFSLRLRT